MPSCQSFWPRIASFSFSIDLRAQIKEEHARNTANGNDLLTYHYKLFPDYDYYFQLFATAPYLQPKSIRECAMRLTASAEYDSCFTAVFNHGFYWLNGTPVNYRPYILPRSQDMLPVVEETTGLYGISNESLRKYRCRIGGNPLIYQVSKFEAVDINLKRISVLQNMSER